jgi:hypothetical protein
MGKRAIVPWMSGKKHTATSGGWGFSPFGDRRGIHRTGAHAQTARPAAFKNLEVMNDEITTTTAAAGAQPQST